MTLQTVSSREFNQDPTAVKKMAATGPVHITHRGTIAYVLMSAQQYETITQSQQHLGDLLAMEEVVEFKPPKADLSMVKAVVFD